MDILIHQRILKPIMQEFDKNQCLKTEDRENQTGLRLEELVSTIAFEKHSYICTINNQIFSQMIIQILHLCDQYVRHNILSLQKQRVVQSDCFLIYFILCEWMLAYTRALKILQYSTAEFVNFCLIWKANFYGRGDISCWNGNIIQSFFFKKVTPF